MLSTLLLGLALGTSIAFFAYRTRSLSRSGALATACVGTVVFGAGTFRWSAILILFFVTSSAFSRLPHAARYAAREGPRDGVQVVANGLIPALAALIELLHPGPALPILFASAVAAAASDTWASELGSRFGGTPRAVLSRSRVAVGTSGGITAAGLGASAAGSALIALASALLLDLALSVALIVALAGVAGSLLDSLLGATVQEVRRCPDCGALTEQYIHEPCDMRTIVVRGVPGMTNDWVNLVSCVTAAALGVSLALWTGAI
jgi:uncharacterized protein (TIGR00297 family)